MLKTEAQMLKGFMEKLLKLRTIFIIIHCQERPERKRRKRTSWNATRAKEKWDKVKSFLIEISECFSVARHLHMKLKKKKLQLNSKQAINFYSLAGR